MHLTYFVPLSGMCEKTMVTLRNTSSKRREIVLFSFLDVVGGDISLELLYPNIMPLYNRSVFEDGLNALVLYKMPSSNRAIENFIVATSTYPISRYDTSREKFLGRYGSLAKPAAVQRGSCFNSLVSGERMVAVLQFDIDIDPGEEVEIATATYFIDQPSQYQILRDTQKPFEPFTPVRLEIEAKVKSSANVEETRAELGEIHRYWRNRFGIQIQSPEKNFNRIVNSWLQYQLIAITCWRGSSPYHGAEGGLGYRDTAQDIEGLLSLDIALARRKLETLLVYQYQNGHAVSGFSDVEGPWDTQGSNFTIGKSDVSVWMVYTVISYLKETGDFDFLHEVFPFVDGGEATVQEHLLRAVRYLYNNVGRNGLPLIGKADWNDAYDRIGIGGLGESVWLGMALARALIQSAELFDYLDDAELKNEMTDKYLRLSQIINDVGWDGQWYLAAFTDGNQKVGSSKNVEGQRPLNSQTWAILSGVVTDERLQKILGIIDNDLDTPYGPALFKPAFSSYVHHLGRVSAFSEGTKENAAVFSHAAAFKNCS